MKMVTDSGHYMRAAVVARAGQIHTASDMTWQQAMAQAFREASEQRKRVKGGLAHV